MIVDTSALVAVVLEEDGFEESLDAIVDDGRAIMSAASALEAAIVLDRRSAASSRRFDALRRQLGIAIAPVTATQFDIAREAYQVYGRGSGSPARLNFGDCFAYALAIEQDQPLLFVGDDFRHTDVRAALPA